MGHATSRATRDVLLWGQVGIFLLSFKAAEQSIHLLSLARVPIQDYFLNSAVAGIGRSKAIVFSKEHVENYSKLGDYFGWFTIIGLQLKLGKQELQLIHMVVVAGL